MTTLDERIRAVVRDEVRTAPAPPDAAGILSRLAVDEEPGGRRPRVSLIVAAVAVAAAAAMVGLVLVRDAVETTGTTPFEPARTEPAPHLLPVSPPAGLVLTAAGDLSTSQPFGPPVTTQLFAREDGAYLRLAVDPWREELALSRAPTLGLEGFATRTVRGQDGGWRNQTLGYGLLWFRVRGTRVVSQSFGLSVAEAVGLADGLVARTASPADGFEPPAGPFRLEAEVLASDTERPTGAQSEVTWLGPERDPDRLTLMTMAGDPREAWRMLLDGSGQLVQIEGRTVLETSGYGKASATWIEGSTVYRLEADGAVAADLPSVLRTLRVVDDGTWRDAVETADAEMAAWPQTRSASFSDVRLSLHRRTGDGATSLCLSVAADEPRCALSLSGFDPPAVSVMAHGDWWIAGVGDVANPQATVLPDQGRATLLEAAADDRWWFASRLSDEATSVTWSAGGADGSAGTYGRPLS